MNTAPIPIASARERKLRSAWAKCDRLEAELRAAKAEARKLEREFSRERGFVVPLNKEALARELERERELDR